ncbi:MAG TPA: DUF2177 family protein [Rhizomicrobium sp.]|nr:DUF2177 family protein [Rhizomicrobium sp.]
MLSIVVRYVVALVVLVVGDIVWLGYFAHAVFQPTLKPILRAEIDWRAAILFYLLYAVGITVFAVAPALANRSAWLALVYGLLFGFLAYMTYDATNYATISAWTIKLAVLDVAWGTFISGVAGLVSYGVTRAVADR